MPFAVPPKRPEITAAAPARALKMRDVDPDMIAEDGEFSDVVDAEGVRWGPRRDWGKV